MNQNNTDVNLFISYYHVDVYFKNKLRKIIGEHFKTKSSPLKYGICDNHDKYTEEIIKNTTENNVFIVLVGNETFKSKNVDWEIDYGLHHNDCLMGLCLPTNNDYLKTCYNPKNLPEKLANNLYAGYASYFDWTDDYNNLESYIETSLTNKLDKHPLFI